MLMGWRCEFGTLAASHQAYCPSIAALFLRTACHGLTVPWYLRPASCQVLRTRKRNWPSVLESLELINAYPIDSYLKSENEHAEHPGSQTKTRNFFNFWYDLLSWCKLLYRIRIAGHILSAFTEKTGKIPFLIRRIAGSLPGEALAPGVSGPDVQFSVWRWKNRSRNFSRFFFQVPGGAAKLSDIAKVGEKYCRNLTGKCWRNWRFVCLYDFFFSGDLGLMAIGP